MAEGWRKFEKRQAVRAIDVAKAAGVSQSAVSRVFRDGSVAPQRRAEILTAAKALGYRPDAMARSIITRRSGIIAIFISANTNLHCPDVLTTLCRAITTQKMRAMVFVVESTQEVEEAVDQALAYRVDGVIALTDIAVEHAKALSELGSILVLYNRDIEGVAANWVGYDHEHDGDVLARHLVNRGATDIWILGGLETSSFATQRLVGLSRGLKTTQTRLSIKHVRGESGFDVIAGCLATDTNEPDAVIVINDTMVIGAIEALRAASHPERSKVLIAGFGGSELSTLQDGPVITLAQPHKRLATAALQIIVSSLQGDSDSFERRMLISNLLTIQSP